LRNIDSSITLFADDCVIYRKITNKNDIEYLQKDLDILGKWAVEYGMKINPGKSKAIRFTRARLKITLDYSLGDQKIPEASCCKYLVKHLRSSTNTTIFLMVRLLLLKYNYMFRPSMLAIFRLYMYVYNLWVG